MSAEIPDDPQEKDFAKGCPQDSPPPYMDENLDEDTCPLISPPAPLSQSQPDHYPAMPTLPSCPSQVSQFPANAKVTVSSRQPTARRANRITVIETTRPNNYIEFSLFNLFFCNFFCCCFCFGAIALYYSLRVNTEYSAGRLEEAIEASRMAKTVNCISFGIGTLGVIFYVLVFASQAANSQMWQ